MEGRRECPGEYKSFALVVVAECPKTPKPTRLEADETGILNGSPSQGYRQWKPSLANKQSDLVSRNSLETFRSFHPYGSRSGGPQSCMSDWIADVQESNTAFRYSEDNSQGDFHSDAFNNGVHGDINHQPLHVPDGPITKNTLQQKKQLYLKSSSEGRQNGDTSNWGNTSSASSAIPNRSPPCPRSNSPTSDSLRLPKPACPAARRASLPLPRPSAACNPSEPSSRCPEMRSEVRQASMCPLPLPRGLITKNTLESLKAGLAASGQLEATQPVPSSNVATPSSVKSGNTSPVSLQEGCTSEGRWTCHKRPVTKNSLVPLARGAALQTRGSRSKEVVRTVHAGRQGCTGMAVFECAEAAKRETRRVKPRKRMFDPWDADERDRQRRDELKATLKESKKPSRVKCEGNGGEDESKSPRQQQSGRGLAGSDQVPGALDVEASSLCRQFPQGRRRGRPSRKPRQTGMGGAVEDGAAVQTEVSPAKPTKSETHNHAQSRRPAPRKRVHAAAASSDDGSLKHADTEAAGASRSVARRKKPRRTVSSDSWPAVSAVSVDSSWESGECRTVASLECPTLPQMRNPAKVSRPARRVRKLSAKMQASLEWQQQQQQQ
eukprot:Rmarinus@m.16179